MSVTYYIEILSVYKVKADSLEQAVEITKNMVVGEFAPELLSLTPTGRYVVGSRGD